MKQLGRWSRYFSSLCRLKRREKSTWMQFRHRNKLIMHSIGRRIPGNSQLEMMKFPSSGRCSWDGPACCNLQKLKTLQCFDQHEKSLLKDEATRFLLINIYNKWLRSALLNILISIASKKHINFHPTLLRTQNIDARRHVDQLLEARNSPIWQFQ